MKYAHGQVPLDESTAKHCSFQIIGGKSTGTHRFKTGPYGPSIIPTEFQKLMNITMLLWTYICVYRGYFNCYKG